jgi:hypothetical protein
MKNSRGKGKGQRRMPKGSDPYDATWGALDMSKSRARSGMPADLRIIRKGRKTR